MNNVLANATNLLATTMPQWVVFVILGVVIVLLFVWFFFSGKKSKQRQKEYVEQLDAIAPGNKVKTAGGICGIVVEVCDDNTVIIKTGSEASGYSFVKMEKELIAQTDAKGPTQIAREEMEAKRRAEKEAASAKPDSDDASAEEEPAKEETHEEAPAKEEAHEEEPKDKE